jgi:hypothetical protein
MKKYPFFTLLYLLPLSLPGAQPAVAADDGPALSVEEQNSAAFEAFNRILELAGERERAGILPELEAAYRDIIRRYPEAHLAQESHLRLMLLYLTDFNPPAFAKAESLRDEFVLRYPDSPLRGILDRTLAESYHKHEQWERLLRFYTPSIRQSIETGGFTRVFDIFMYAEAKFGLNDLVEAEKGYKIVISVFSETREGSLAKKRLEEIQTKKTKRPE